MDPHTFTVKLIQNGISNTIIGVVAGGLITLGISYFVESFKYKLTQKNNENAMLIELKKHITYITAKTLDVEKEQLKLAMMSQVTAMMNFYDTISHIEKLKDKQLHTDFMAFHFEVYNMIAALDDEEPDEQIFFDMRSKTKPIIDKINRQID